VCFALIIILYNKIMQIRWEKEEVIFNTLNRGVHFLLPLNLFVSYYFPLAFLFSTL